MFIVVPGIVDFIIDAIIAVDSGLPPPTDNATSTLLHIMIASVPVLELKIAAVVARAAHPAADAISCAASATSHAVSAAARRLMGFARRGMHVLPAGLW